MWVVYSLLAFGLLLIFFEFFLPGGVMAVGGALLVLASLFTLYKTSQELSSFLYFAVILISSFTLVVRLAIWKAKGKKGSMVLETDQEGFQASVYPKEFIGKRAIAATDLKPSGHIWIEERGYQALSQTGCIDKGSLVEILGGHGSYLIVRQIME